MYKRIVTRREIWSSQWLMWDLEFNTGFDWTRLDMTIQS